MTHDMTYPNPTDVSEGDRVTVTDLTTDTEVCTGVCVNATPGWFTLDTPRGPRHFDFAPEGQVEAADTANRYTVTAIQTPMTDGGVAVEAEDAETFTFADDDGDDGDLTFRVVRSFTNSYGDQRVQVETPAPWDTPDDVTPANDVVKALEWDDHHYTFDGDAEAWEMDATALEPLHDLAADAGYAWDVAFGSDDDAAEGPAGWTDLCGAVEEGDHVAVTYAKKNGNGENTYAGEVVMVRGTEYTDDWGQERATGIVFEDTDGKTKRVRLDDGGTPSLYCGGYHPYMGEVVAVTVTA